MPTLGTVYARGLLAALALSVTVLLAPMTALAKNAPRFICSAPGSAKVPCRFSTPSGNIRCVWTPQPESVACVLRSSGRAYRLRPRGHAKKITLTLTRAGQTLPLDQQLAFPQSLSCHDTRVSMSCNQDFGLGAFTLAPHGSHAS
ncbi:MAG TPA: hypothetical protein VII03_04720 [Solirubrobacteraceae bacterium]